MNTTTNPVIAGVADASGEMLALQPSPTNVPPSVDLEEPVIRRAEGGAAEYPPLPSETCLGGDADFGDQAFGYTSEQMHAYVDVDRAARAAMGRLIGEASGGESAIAARELEATASKMEVDSWRRSLLVWREASNAELIENTAGLKQCLSNAARLLLDHPALASREEAPAPQQVPLAWLEEHDDGRMRLFFDADGVFDQDAGWGHKRTALLSPVALARYATLIERNRAAPAPSPRATTGEAALPELPEHVAIAFLVPDGKHMGHVSFTSMEDRAYLALSAEKNVRGLASLELFTAQQVREYAMAATTVHMQPMPNAMALHAVYANWLSGGNDSIYKLMREAIAADRATCAALTAAQPADGKGAGS